MGSVRLRGPAHRARRRPHPRARLGLGVAACLVLAGGLAGDHNGTGPDVDRYETAPGLSPPELTVDTAADAAVDSARPAYSFVAPWRGDGQAGPMIVNGRGELVWFHPMTHAREAMDFRVQRYQDQSVLTWWEGQVNEDGYGVGDYVVADRSYRQIARFETFGGRWGDFHEFLITLRDTALVTIYKPVRHDLSPVGGTVNGTVLESIIQEVDVQTGRVLFEWRALDHVALAESHETVPDEPDEMFDHFHVNSIDVDHDGNLLISARHTDTVYKIDRQTGEVLWRLGGTRSDFTFGPGARFFSQHDARRQSDGTITLFDNSNPPKRREQSRAITLRLDMSAMRATLEQSVEHPLELSSDSQGNAQALPGGSMAVGWGSQPFVSWFDAGGDLVFGAHFPEDTDVYRAYRSPWTGRPTGRPSVSVNTAGIGEIAVHASWNGATEVARWQVLTGSTPHRLSPVRSHPWEGFETTMTAHTDQDRVAVQAVSQSGTPLGRSRVLTLQR